MDLSLRLHCFCPVTGCQGDLCSDPDSLLSNHFYWSLSLAEALDRSLANTLLHFYRPMDATKKKKSPPPLGSGLRLTVKGAGYLDNP